MKGKRFVRILGASSLVAMTISAILALWTARAEAFAHYRPEYAQIDLLPILQKDKLTEEDYSILFRQTGLARAGIDELLASGRQDELLYLQQRYFANPEIECLHNNLFIRSERLVKGKEMGEASAFIAMPVGAALSAASPSGIPNSYVPFPTVQPGDILITYSGHVFGWRSGHAAIVIDAEGQLTLEAITMGCESRICSLADWEEYPSVALLRLKDASLQEREQIAAYAEEHLQGLPYSLAVFTILGDSIGKASSDTANPSIFSGFLARSISCIVSFGTGMQLPDSGQTMETAPPLTGTQCAHLVWYAYRNFGYDLDGDGGFVVTPDDLYHSDLLELVQIYGIPPNY